MKLLLIDDDIDFLFLMSSHLRRKGFEVFTAINGLRALTEMELHPADIIISDVIMNDTPIMSLTLTLKHFYPDIPLIIISGSPKEALIKKTLTLGADAFLPKPINIPRLLSKIQQFNNQA